MKIIRGEKAKAIRRMAKLHPQWSYRRIAESCGATVSMVSRALKCVGQERSVFALGKAARDCGFTVADIRALAQREVRP